MRGLSQWLQGYNYQMVSKRYLSIYGSVEMKMRFMDMWTIPECFSYKPQPCISVTILACASSGWWCLREANITMHK